MLFLFSCGQKENALNADLVSDPQFDPYKETFIMEAKRRDLDVEMEVSDLPIFIGPTERLPNGRTSYAHCSLDNPRHIVVSLQAMSLDKFQLERLIFHELGHCILNRDHVKSKNSIMDVDSYDSWSRYKRYRYFFLNELFSEKEESVPRVINHHFCVEMERELELVQSTEYQTPRGRLLSRLYRHQDSGEYCSQTRLSAKFLPKPITITESLEKNNPVR